MDAELLGWRRWSSVNPPPPSSSNHHRCRTRCSARNPKYTAATRKYTAATRKLLSNALVRATFGLLQCTFGLLQCVSGCVHCNACDSGGGYWRKRWSTRRGIIRMNASPRGTIYPLFSNREILLGSAQDACALVASAIPSLTAGESAARLVGSGFIFCLFERYSEWFDNNSSVSMTHGSHICMQPLSRRSASNRTSTGGCGLVRRKRIARRPATRKKRPVRPRSYTTRTTRRVPSKCSSSAATSLARTAPGWRVRANLRKGSCPSPRIKRRFSTRLA
eukprot:scaffold76338_cov55-Phaeocystis_antarctica.AAC.1